MVEKATCFKWLQNVSSKEPWRKTPSRLRFRGRLRSSGPQASTRLSCCVLGKRLMAMGWARTHLPERMAPKRVVLSNHQDGPNPKSGSSPSRGSHPQVFSNPAFRSLFRALSLSFAQTLRLTRCLAHTLPTATCQRAA